ncbi:MAG: autotransporter assembly complex protein TamA [Aeromonadaceae bacterium]
MKLIVVIHGLCRIAHRFGLIQLRGALLLCLGLSLPIPTLAKPVHFEVSGIKGEVRENVETYLEALPSFQADRLLYRRKQILEAVTKGLQALGYYSARVELSQDEANKDTVLVKIDPDKPIVIRSLKVSLQGDALNDKVFDRLLKKLPLKQGDVLHHGKYEEIKSNLTNRALARGYFDAEMVRSSIKVYPREYAADVVIEFSSGHRYRFGEINIVGVTQSQRLIKPLITFKPGDPYVAQKLATLSQSLSETRYFRQVDVHPLLKQSKDYRVPIHVGLEPKSNNLVEVGVGFSTDEGVRAQLNWEKPWLNQYGHSLNAQLKISTSQPSLTFNYRIPGKDPNNDYYNLQSSYEVKDSNDTYSQLSQVGVHYWTKKLGDWERDYFVRLEYEDYEQGLSRGNSLLLIPGITLSRLRIDRGLDPEWGDRLILSSEFSQPAWGSDIGFTRLRARAKWLRTPWEGARFISRIEQGWIGGENIEQMPASLRFFAGGDQSVRGFGYETISPTDASGQLTGARYLTTGSMEYDHPVAEKWRLATFVDAGTATNDYRDPLKIGTGMGVRWLSPLGPIRFDLAFGVSEVHVPWRLHFGLGAEL